MRAVGQRRYTTPGRSSAPQPSRGDEDAAQNTGGSRPPSESVFE